MQKLRVFENVSVDGYFTDANGDMSWAHAAARSPELDEWTAANASGGGSLLFGRKTYEMMASFWPTPAAAQQMPEVAKGMNASKKYVATRTLTPTWTNATKLEGDLVTAVGALKRTDGPGIVILGSGSIAAQLAEAGLVDEWQFVIVPVAVGGGRTVFTQRQPLKLVEQRAFPSGQVVVTYVAAR